MHSSTGIINREEETMKIGDIVFHQEYGVGQIEDIDESFEPFQYLVYYYKENISLHNGNGGSNYHYWWSWIEDLISISPLRFLIIRRQHG